MRCSYLSISVSNSEAHWEIPIKFNRETDIQDMLSAYCFLSKRDKTEIKKYTPTLTEGLHH